MFYTIIQEADRTGGWRGERFVSFEADSQEEANDRAIWFGIDFGEMVERRHGETRRWTWYRNSCGTASPEIARVALPRARSENIEGEWTIVYKDDNLRSSMAVLPENEHDPHFIEESMAVPYTASPYIFFSYMPLTTT